MTLRETFIAALQKRGETIVKETFRYVVYTRHITLITGERQRHGHYYIGRSGSLRVGHTVASSIPAHPGLKAQLKKEVVA